MTKSYIKTLLVNFLLVVGLLIPAIGYAAQKPVNVYFFYADGCPHCEKEHIFLDNLEEEYSSEQLEVYRFEVSKDIHNANLLIDMGKKLDTEITGTPFTVINDKYVKGYNSDKTTGAVIEKLIKESLGIIDEQSDEDVVVNSDTQVAIPWYGEIELKDFSLPAATIILGVLDGFNPCAMWALIFLISVLLGMEDKRRMWILGSAFIITSALVYFMFMTAWLQLVLFIGFVFWVRIMIGLVALVGGGVNLRDWWKNKDGACKVTSSEKRTKTFEKIKNYVHRQQFWIALGGIMLLAIAVNMVELICSAGLPAIYAQILAINDLSDLQRYSYIGLYILFFMIDDLIVFFIAMATLKIAGLSTKYSRYSNLIGGTLMVIIGLLLIFKPGWLMFG